VLDRTASRGVGGAAIRTGAALTRF
jgi:hypothetical protein